MMEVHGADVVASPSKNTKQPGERLISRTDDKVDAGVFNIPIFRKLTLKLGATTLMPLAKIEVRKTWPPEQVQAIIEAIYLAQREALNVPAHDRQIRFIEHRPEHFHVPPG